MPLDERASHKYMPLDVDLNFETKKSCKEKEFFRYKKIKQEFDLNSNRIAACTMCYADYFLYQIHNSKDCCSYYAIGWNVEQTFSCSRHVTGRRTVMLLWWTNCNATLIDELFYNCDNATLMDELCCNCDNATLIDELFYNCDNATLMDESSH